MYFYALEKWLGMKNNLESSRNKNGYLLEKLYITSNNATVSENYVFQFGSEFSRSNIELIFDDSLSLKHTKNEVILELKTLFNKTIEFLEYRHITPTKGRIRECYYYDSSEETVREYSIDIYIKHFSHLNIFDQEEEVWEQVVVEEIIGNSEDEKIGVLISLIEEDLTYGEE